NRCLTEAVTRLKRGSNPVGPPRLSLLCGEVGARGMDQGPISAPLHSGYRRVITVFRMCIPGRTGRSALSSRRDDRSAEGRMLRLVLVQLFISAMLVLSLFSQARGQSWSEQSSMLSPVVFAVGDIINGRLYVA